MAGRILFHIVVEVDRWLIIGIIGIIGMIVSAVGEFLGWWRDAGTWGFWVSLGLAVVGIVTNATRGQGKLILRRMDRADATMNRVEAGVNRVEAAVGRVEANTAVLPEVRDLLRDIRDRLPERA